VVPTRRARATDACRAIIDHLLDIFPNPEELSTDRGSHFTAALNAEFATMNAIRWKYHIAFRPQSCGALEARHRELKNATFVAVHSLGLDWADVIRRVAFLMNTVPNKSTKTSPFEVVFGQKARVGEFDKDSGAPTGNNIPDYMRNRQKVTELIREKLAICQESADQKVREKHPRHTPEILVPGDEVLINKQYSVIAKRSKIRFLGPYTVTRTNGYVVQVCDDDGNTDWFHRSMVVKKVKRLTELGPVPYFPAFSVPLPKTQPSQPTVPLQAAPDNIQAPELEKPDENRSINNTDLSENTRNSINNDNSTSIADKAVENNTQRAKPRLSIQIPCPRKRALENSTLQNAENVSQKRPKPAENPKLRVNPRLPNMNLPRATTRSRATRENDQIADDRELALDIRNQERRTSSRTCGVKFPARNPFSK
jgi:hypothetical protein